MWKLFLGIVVSLSFCLTSFAEEPEFFFDDGEKDAEEVWNDTAVSAELEGELESEQSLAEESANEETEPAGKVPAKVPAKVPTKTVKKQMAVPKKKMTAKTNANKTWKQGFKTTSSTCEMHLEPSDSSKSVLSLAPGKKLWLEAHNDSWLKAFRKNGIGYISKNCF